MDNILLDVFGSLIIEHLFFVLRLCGSRQVVAHCCADEQIIQMHILCPLGSRKWSADHYAVRSLVRPKKQETQKQAKQQKQNPQNPVKEALTKTAPIGLATYVPRIRTTPDHTAKSCEGVQQNNPLSSAETQDPPCQDPGDRAEFFSVLRLCGSRQVVTHCRAVERITQMQCYVPHWGVKSGVGQDQNTKTKTTQKQKTTKKKQRREP